MSLDKEAVRITGELGKVVFVGALAVNHYTEFRATRDIDLAMAGPLDEKKLIGLGYMKKEGSASSWYSPRGVQVDIYTRDVGRVPVDWILKASVVVKVGRKHIEVISLEGLIIAKHRAGRSQDVDDLRQLMASRSKDIRWEVMGELGTSIEVAELREVARAFGTLSPACDKPTFHRRFKSGRPHSTP